MHQVKHGSRVEAEAAALEAAGHAGVVQLVDVAGDTLRTWRIDGACAVAEAGPFSEDEIAGLLASVAATLADLHAAGVVHGGIDATHVLLHPEGRTVLCSLGRGGSPADDVAALGQLVTELLVSPPPAPPAPALPRPDGRRRRRRSVHRVPALFTPPVGPVLAELAAAATAGDPADRPTARELATAVHHRVATARVPLPPGREPLLARPRPPASRRRRPLRRPPGADSEPSYRRIPVSIRLGSEEAPGEDRRRPGQTAGADSEPFYRRIPAPNRLGSKEALGRARRRPLRSAGLLLCGLLGVPLLLLAGTSLASSDVDPQQASRPAAEPTTTTTTVATTTAPPAAVRVWPADPLHYEGGVLTVDGVRYAVGQPGDAVVAGDWACTGRRTVALLRPPTGEVFAFDAWADAGEVPGRLVGTVEGAAGLRAVAGDDGCDDLEVVRPDAEAVLVEASPEAT